MRGQPGECANDGLRIAHRPEDAVDPRSGDRGEERAQVETHEDLLVHMRTGVGEDAPAADEAVGGRVHGNPAQDLLEQTSERLPEKRRRRLEQPWHGIGPADPRVPVEVVGAGRSAPLETFDIGDPRQLLHRDLKEFRQSGKVVNRRHRPAKCTHPAGNRVYLAYRNW